MAPRVSAQPRQARQPLQVFADELKADLAQFEVAEALYVKALGGKFHEFLDGIVVSHSQLAHPSFNTALNLTSTPKGFARFVALAEEELGKEGAPGAFVVSPASQPPDAAKRLEGLGYWKSRERLWMELMQTVPPRPDDPRLAVKVTQDTGGWSDTVAKAVGVPDHAPFLRELARLSREAPRHHLLLASFGGRPAGACEVTADNGVGVIRHLGVLDEYRGRKVALAMMHEAFELLDDFRVVRLATRVFAGTGAEAVFERYGFVGTHLTETYLKGPAPFLLD